MAWDASRSPRPSQNDSGLLVPALVVAGVLVLFYIAPNDLTGRHHAPSMPPTYKPSDPQSFRAEERRSTSVSQTTTDPLPPTSSTPIAAQYSTFAAAESYRDGKYHLLLCATGSVASIKIPNICNALSQYSNLSIRVVLSHSATEFLQGQSHEQPHWGTLKQIKNVDGVYVDSHEWNKPWRRGDNILHIELRRWADLMVIAPLSANCLAKMALGMSDNLVMSVARAWDTTGQIDRIRPGIMLEGNAIRKTIMVAPAMNTAMFYHAVTVKHMQVLVGEWGVQNGGWIELLAPIEKSLACGDAGSGAMREWTAIVRDIERKLPKLKKEPEATSAARIE